MANNIFYVKRTSTSGRQPNTTGSYATNSQYIAAGEFALNMADGVLYTSNGTAVITVGANIVNLSVTNNANVANVLSVGNATGSYAFNPISVMTNYGNQNNYVQHVLQNASSGLNASGDIVLTNDTGNDTIGFIDLGINSSTYSNAAYNITGAGDGYLYTSNGHLAIGTASGKELIFHANGTTSTDRKFTINATAVTFADSVAIVANGSVGTSGQVLTTNTTGVYWSTASGGATGGANTQVLFNDSGSSNGSASFTFNKSTNAIGITGPLTTSNTTISGANVFARIFANSATMVTYFNTFQFSVISANSNPNIASFVSANTNAAIYIDTNTTGFQSTINFSDATTSKWQIGKQGDNSFFMWDQNNSKNFFTVNTTGNMVLGEASGLQISNTGVLTIANTLTLGSLGLSANGSVGTAGQLLTSNGSAAYWAAAGASTLDYGGAYALKAFYG